MIRTPNVGTNSDTNQGLTTDPKFIIVELDYEHKVILPISEGLKYIEIIANGMHVSKKYDGPIKPMDKTPKLSLEFVTEQEIKEAKLSAIIDPGVEI